MALNINGTTGISGVDGSLSAPALTGTDSNTGITFPSADTIKFSAGGVEKFSISSSGLSGDGSGLSGISAGVSQIDQWYVTSNFTGSVNPISSNLARYTSAGGYLGGGMTQSSGTFTFPSTGFWKIDVEGTVTRIEAGRQSRHQEINILATTNNSSYSTISQAQAGYFDNYNAGYRYIGCFSSVVFDCTDTSTHKVRFQTVVQDNDSQGCRWDTPYLKMAFIKLADT
tara:strand:- start:273 stop:953 length:681 start_codon:yes stop_codon:yes gene_type:complete